MHKHRLSSIASLGPRIPAPAEAMGKVEAVRDIAVPNRVVVPRADSTSSSCGENACEKPISSATFTSPIVLGIM